MLKRSKNSARKAILTNIERAYLTGKKTLSIKSKSKLLHKLDGRFLELFKDLEIIKRSKVLDAWKASRYGKLITPVELDLLRQIFESAKPVHLSIIRHFKEQKKSYFWLDHSPHMQLIPRIDEKSLKPTYVLRKISYNLKESFGSVLLDAYSRGKIPTEKEKAITLEELRKILS